MQVSKKTTELFESLVKKATLKQRVYKNTLDAFNMLKVGMDDLSRKYDQINSEEARSVPFTYRNRGEFEAELKFAGDTLVFMMHTNVFEFSRDHEVMKTDYIKEDPDRAYCGVIHIFNFLSDSFKYQRMNDIGYLIGRLYINKDMHYFIEGKRELGFLFNNFGNADLTQEHMCEILESAIYYTINFDLLIPPYDNIKEVSVMEFKTTADSMQIKTGKRLGFKFQADLD